MGINHMDVQKMHKKTILANHEAEESFSENRKLSLDPLASEDMVENSVLKDETANPLIKRELMLRMENALQTDGEDTTLTQMVKDLDEGKYFDAEEIAEKQWVSRSMDSFVQKQEKERKRRAYEEEKKKRAEATEKNRRIREKKDLEAFASEHTAKKNSSRLYNMIAEARNLIGVTRDVYQLEYIPSKELMVKDYKGAFSDKVNDRKRAEKKKNKRSRLFQKIKNEELLKRAEEESAQSALAAMEETVNAQRLVLSDEEAYRDLSQFMMQGNKEYNLTLLRKYIGNNENKGPGGREGQDIQVALDMMAQTMFAIDISSISFKTDADMVRNASVLESISNRVAAFDRMAEKHHYMDNIEGSVKDMLEERLQSLRSIAAYYNIRKEIIKNPYYRDHYNEELSMDIMAAKTKEQTEIAELLNKSYLLGQTMMRLNGVDEKRMARRAEPKFKHSDMKGIYEGMKSRYKNPEELKKLVSTAYSEKTTETKKSMESTVPYQARLEKEKADQILDRISKNSGLFETAVDNLLAEKGSMRANTKEKDAPYSEESLKVRLEEFEKLDIHEMKCASISDLILHYHENMKLCKQAEDIHFELAKGLAHGFKLSDEDAKRIRAKLSFFHSIRVTTAIINNSMVKDKKNSGKTDAEWKDYIKNYHAGKKIQVPVFLPGSADELLLQCEKKVNEETDNLDDKIKHLWRYISPAEPAGEVPPEEIAKRKEGFHSNALTAEFLDRQIDIRIRTSNADAVLKVWCQRNGKEFQQIDRTAMSFIREKSADEMIRLYKLRTGTSGEQYQFWKEVYKSYSSMPVEQFSTTPRYKFFDEFYKKQALSIVGANFNDVTNAMATILKEKNNRGWLKLPEGVESIEELQREGQFKYDFCCSYISGPLDALLQQPPTAYRSLMSLEEMGTYSDERIELILRRFYDAELGNIKDEDTLSEEYNGIYKAVYNACNFLQQEINSRKKKLGTQRKRASLDMDLVELEKEERRYLENDLHAKDKEYLDKYNQESERLQFWRNDAVNDFYNNVIRKDPKRYMSINPRKYSSLLCNMSYLQGTTEKETVETFKKMTVADGKATKEERVAKRVEFEKILKFILDFDLNLLSFNSMDDLLSANNLDLRQMCRMMWDFDNDEFLTAYTELREKYPDAGCTMDRKTIQLIAQKNEFIKGMAALYDTYVQLKGTEGFDPDQFLKLSPDEIMAAMMKDDPSRQELYQNVTTVAFSISEGYGPPVNAEKLFQEQLKSGMLMTQKAHIW